MPRTQTYTYTCDNPNCSQSVSISDHSSPEGWSELNINMWIQPDPCTCKCHEMEGLDPDSGRYQQWENSDEYHEEWDCEDCPPNGDYEEYEDKTLCSQCTWVVRNLLTGNSGPKKGFL